MATTKSTAKKSTPKKSTSAKATPVAKQSAEEKISGDILKLVDQAAALLRSGVRTGAKNTGNARVAAAKKAHSLLTKATGGLTHAIEDTSSTLQKGLKKLGS